MFCGVWNCFINFKIIYNFKIVLLNDDNSCLPRCYTFRMCIAIVAIVVVVYLSAHFIAIVTWHVPPHTISYWAYVNKQSTWLYKIDIYTTKELPKHWWSLFSRSSSVSFLANSKWCCLNLSHGPFTSLISPLYYMWKLFFSNCTMDST